MQVDVQTQNFIQDHLDRVSRSFAFCIRQLPEPLREWIGVSYLLCRIIDTIEDSQYPNTADQIRAFDWFDRSLTELSASSDAYVFPKSLFPLEMTAGERLLLEDSARVFRVFWSMESDLRSKIGDLALSMSRGMRHFTLRRPGLLKLESLKEVNQYCFFVAGLVGEMLVLFLARVEPRVKVEFSRLLRAYHFGLFLQKVNLLKDQVKDQKVGRFLVPSREQTEASAIKNAQSAMVFLTDVPVEQAEFRRFCAWSLFLGLQSLNASQTLTRTVTESILSQVEEALCDNHQLWALFKTFTHRLGWMIPPEVSDLKEELMAADLNADSNKDSLWIQSLYKGQLTPAGFRALGMI